MTSEQLLLLCASAIEENNVSVAQQAVRALKRNSSFNGGPSERVTAYFLEALLRRGGSMQLDLSQPFGNENTSSHDVQWTQIKLSLSELASIVDLTPHYRFGYTAANGALLEAFEGLERVHILDFSTTHGMQWPTFIEALADRMEGPPNVRLTFFSAALPTPPRLQTSYEDVGSRLRKFARLKQVPFEFNILPQPLESLSRDGLGLREGEALGVNCSLRLHYLADESAVPMQVQSSTSGAARIRVLNTQHVTAQSLCPRDRFLQLIHSLNPAIVTLYEEDCDTTSTDVVRRLQESYNYEWMPFDIIATFLPADNPDREEYEKNVGRKIQNIVACEGLDRLERLESKRQWVRRMNRLRFRALPISDDVNAALQELVDDHNSGWGMKQDDDDTQSLLWKGNKFSFASAWISTVIPPELVTPAQQGHDIMIGG